MFGLGELVVESKLAIWMLGIGELVARSVGKKFFLRMLRTKDMTMPRRTFG